MRGLERDPGAFADPAEPAQPVERDRARAAAVRRVGQDQVVGLAIEAERKVGKAKLTLLRLADPA